MTVREVKLYGIPVGMVGGIIAMHYYPFRDGGCRETKHRNEDEAEAAVIAGANAFFASVIRAAVESP